MLISNVAELGMMLLTVPARNAPTVSTAGWCGEVLRDTSVCKAITMLDPTTTGSMHFSGSAPCPPRPSTVTVTASIDAAIAPLRQSSVPAGVPG